MGCGSAKGKAPETPMLRRRLSLGEIGPGSDDVSTEVSDADRSLITALTQKQILDFVSTDATAGRKYSVGSETDQKGNLAQSFSSKSVGLQGDKFESATEGIGYACKKGLKPEAPNQDSFFIMKVEDNFCVYGVFDGHGRKGHDVSNFVKENLPKILFSQDMLHDDPPTALEKTFEKTQYLIEKATAMKKIDASRSGSTCSVVLHDLKKKMLYVAHVGDSRVVLGKATPSRDGKKVWNAVDLTIDHKPDLPEERARIEKAGGVVLFDGGWNYRVYAKGKTDSRGKRYPGLNMSRAMGDLSGFNDAGISAKPDVNKRFVSVQPQEGAANKGEKNGEIEADRRPSTVSSQSHPTVSSHNVDTETDKLLLLCSDGVWEFISSEQAIKFVGRFPKTEASNAAEQLATTAWDQWMREMDGKVVDDITAIVIYL